MNNVLLEMMKQRKYTDIQVSEDSDQDTSVDITCKDEQGKTVYVKKLLMRLKLPHFFKKYIESLEDAKEAHHIIILCKKHSSSFAKLCEPYSVELFREEELQINITKHVLVPEHIRIPSYDKDKINEILKKFSCDSVSTLPAILQTDPVCKFFGGKSGDLFKIKRNSIISGTYESYRYVI